MNLISLLIVALILEALWETLKMALKNGKLDIDRVGAMLLGLLLAVGTGLDLLDLVGVPMKIPYVGMLLTGLLLSRGANFVHDILGSINNLNQNTKSPLFEINTGVEDTEDPVEPQILE